MFGSPRVLAVDDKKTHLDGLVNGLQRNGVACLPIHFPDGLSALVDTCPDVRIIFADLHLVGQASDYTRQFTALGGLIEATIGFGRSMKPCCRFWPTGSPTCVPTMTYGRTLSP